MMPIERPALKAIHAGLAFVALCGGAGLARGDEAPAAKITYEEHVKPILREHCFLCHNQGQAKSDLALDNYGALVRGGASGEVVIPGDPDNSRLWLLVTHQDSPPMPPEKDKLPTELLDTLRKWIEGGALENSGSVAKVKKKPKIDLTTATGAAQPEGPPPMPEGLSRRPITQAGRGSAVSALAASPWAPLMAVGSWRQILLYHADTAELLGVLPFPEGTPYVLKFSRNGGLLLAGGGHAAKSGRVVVYDVKSGERVFEVGDELDAVLAADINEDHTRIALGGPSKMLRIYSLEDGSLLHDVKKHTDWILSVEFSPDGVLLASADRAGNLYVWEPDGAREYLNLKGHTAAVTDVCWRDDSNVLASAGLDAQVRLWEMENGTQIKNWATGGSGIEAIEFDHTGRLATAGRDKLIQVWDQNGQSLKCFEAFGDLALDVALSHDGRRAVGGDWTGEIRLLDVENTQITGRLAMSPPSLAELAAAETARAQAALATAEQAAAQLVALEQQLAEISARVQQAVSAAQTTAAEAQTASQRAAEAATAAQQLAAELSAVQQKLTAEKSAVETARATAAEAEASARRAAEEQAAAAAQGEAQASAAP